MPTRVRVAGDTGTYGHAWACLLVRRACYFSIRKRPNRGLAMFFLCVVLLWDRCSGMCVVCRACPSMSAGTMGMLVLL